MTPCKRILKLCMVFETRMPKTPCLLSNVSSHDMKNGIDMDHHINWLNQMNRSPSHHLILHNLPSTTVVPMNLIWKWGCTEVRQFLFLCGEEGFMGLMHANDLCPLAESEQLQDRVRELQEALDRRSPGWSSKHWCQFVDVVDRSGTHLKQVNRFNYLGYVVYEGGGWEWKQLGIYEGICRE